MTSRSPRVFYGWWIVAASFFIAWYVGGIVMYGFTAIFEPIADEMGWSYTIISLSASIRGLEAGIAAPVIGILVDKWGPRRMIFFGGILTAIGLILLSRTTTIAIFYIASIIIAIGVSACTMTVLSTAIANWFRKKMGTASGIAVSGFGLGGLVIPLMVKLIDLYDWRTTIAGLAIGVLVLVLPLSSLFRHKPEQYGYVPDGEQQPVGVPDNNHNLATITETNVKARPALRSKTFWLLTIVFAWHMLVMNATAIHVMPYLTSIGVIRSRSSLIATSVPLMSIFGRLGLGWLGDRFSRKKVTAWGFSLMGIGLLCFGYAALEGPWLLIPFLILFGIGYGGTNTLKPALIRQYFGRGSFGTLFGLLMGITTIGGIAGAPMAGYTYDTLGSYQGIWFLFAGLSIVAIVLVLIIRPPKIGNELVDTSRSISP